MNITKTLTVLSFTLLLLVNSSCIKNLLCIRGNGIPATEDRITAQFTGIENATDANVIVETGEVTSILIESDANLLHYYTTSVRNGVLEIDVKGTACLTPVTPTFIRITVPRIETVKLTGSGDFIADLLDGEEVDLTSSGSGNISVDNIESTSVNATITGSGDITVFYSLIQELVLKITGSGDATIAGIAETGYFTSTGSGVSHCSDLFLSDCNASISGSGDIYVSVSDNLIVNISGSGNLYYFGNPQVSQSRTGSGNVIPLSR